MIIITHVDYVDDQTHVANTPDVGLYVNSDKTEFILFNQDGFSSSLNDKPLKLVYQFIYLGSNFLSTETDVSMHKGKALITFDRLTTIWKSGLW